MAEGSAKELRTEIRSYFSSGAAGYLPSDTPPCEAPEGHYWVHAFSPKGSSVDPLSVGKWLIRVQCRYVTYCWNRVRQATEEGTLGIGAKVSTDWGNANDPAAPGGWADHVICVYTYDWRDREDVGRVARCLGEIDAIRRQTLFYKPDAMTYDGIYSGNTPGGVAIYEMKRPYEQLFAREDALSQLHLVLRKSR